MNRVRGLMARAGSIRVRLTLWYVALLAVILVLFSGVLYLSLSRGLAEEMDISLSTEAARRIASMDFEKASRCWELEKTPITCRLEPSPLCTTRPVSAWWHTIRANRCRPFRTR